MRYLPVEPRQQGSASGFSGGQIVKSYNGSVQSRATVIYCHHLAKARYALGWSYIQRWGHGRTLRNLQEWKYSSASPKSCAGCLPQWQLFRSNFPVDSRRCFPQRGLAEARPHFCGSNCIGGISTAGSSSASAEPQQDTWAAHLANTRPQAVRLG